MPQTVGGGISILNQGKKKLSLALDCISITVFSFKPYIEHTASVSSHRQELHSHNPCPGSIVKNMLSKVRVYFVLMKPHSLLCFKYV